MYGRQGILRLSLSKYLPGNRNTRTDDDSKQNFSTYSTDEWADLTVGKKRTRRQSVRATSKAEVINERKESEVDVRYKRNKRGVIELQTNCRAADEI